MLSPFSSAAQLRRLRSIRITGSSIQVDAGDLCPANMAPTATAFAVLPQPRACWRVGLACVLRTANVAGVVQNPGARVVLTRGMVKRLENATATRGGWGGTSVLSQCASMRGSLDLDFEKKSSSIDSSATSPTRYASPNVPHTLQFPHQTAVLPSPKF